MLMDDNNELARKVSYPIVSRRRVLTGLASGAAMVSVPSAVQAACSLTAAQVDGPFYPVVVDEQDWDLTRVAGGSGRASGEVIEITGQVTDAKCNPVGGCVLEIWQANANGRYAHPRDGAEDRPLDPNFQGYARVSTDENGEYRFVTIKPGSYMAMGPWMRPPHIHVHVSAPFNPSVTTQMYFAGDPLNDADRLLQELTPGHRSALEVSFDQSNANGAKTGRFDLVLAEGWVPPAELLEQINQG